MSMYELSPKAPKNRVFARVHTRKLDRLVAHKNMERAGLRRVNKHDCVTYQTMTGMLVQEYQPSYFARHWKETVGVPTIDLRRKSK